MIQPQAGPYSWGWDVFPATVQLDPNEPPRAVHLTRLGLQTTGGTATVFMMPDDLEKFLDQGREKLQEARTGIVRASAVPPNGVPRGLLGPDGQVRP
jgi:hypothetical protein